MAADALQPGTEPAQNCVNVTPIASENAVLGVAPGSKYQYWKYHVSPGRIGKSPPVPSGMSGRLINARTRPSSVMTCLPPRFR